MCVYYKDRPEWLQLSIESMLNQTVPPGEILIVEDGVLPQSLETVIRTFTEKYPRVFHIITLETNQGLGAALHAGLAECSNELVARMDSDDISKSDRLEKQLSAFESDPELSIVGSSVDEFIDDPDHVVSRRVLPENHEDIIRFAHRRNPFNHPSIMFKKSDVLLCGNYQPFHLLEDYYLWVRMLSRGKKAKNLPESLLYMRISRDFYKRRGGLQYYISIFHLRTYMYRYGFSNFRDYLFGIVGHFIICMIPNRIRRWAYQNLARKPGNLSEKHIADPSKMTRRRPSVRPEKITDITHRL